MLVIDKNVNLEELKKYGIHPEYECNSRTGETRIVGLNKDYFTLSRLRFKKINKKIAGIKYISEVEYVLVLNNETNEMIDLDTLYDLIQAGIVRKVG